MESLTLSYDSTDKNYKVKSIAHIFTVNQLSKIFDKSTRLLTTKPFINNKKNLTFNANIYCKFPYEPWYHPEKPILNR